MSDTQAQAADIAERCRTMKDPSDAHEFGIACRKYCISLKAELKPAEAIEALQDALSSIAQWILGEAPVAEGFRCWKSLTQLPAEVCPADIPIAVLSRFGYDEPGAQEWLEASLAIRRSSIVAAMIKANRLSTELILELAKNSPERLAASSVLEEVPPHSQCWSLPGLWRAVVACLERDLDKRAMEASAKAYIQCYLASKDKKSDELTLSDLVALPADSAAKLVDRIVIDPNASLRFTTHLIDRLIKPSTRKLDDAPMAAMIIVAKRTAALMENGIPGNAIPAGNVMAFLAAAHAMPGGRHRSVNPVGNTEFEAVRDELPAMVRKLAGSPAGAAPVFATGDQIRAITPNPKSLPQESASRAVETDANTRIAPAGVSDLLVDLTLALHAGDEAIPLDQRLDALLFNRGVSPFGELGSIVPYDARRHTTADAGVFPGDPMRIVRPGQEIVLKGVTRVLVKATVAAE